MLLPPANYEKLQEKRKKNLNDLRLLFLELVHLGLHSGKVWENRFFSILQTLVGPYRKPLLRLTEDMSLYWKSSTSKNCALNYSMFCQYEEIKSFSYRSLRLYQLNCNVRSDVMAFKAEFPGNLLKFSIYRVDLRWHIHKCCGTQKSPCDMLILWHLLAEL